MMATMNSAGIVQASDNSRVHIGNNNYFPERPETPAKPSFTIPFCRDVDFIERKTLLDRIHQTCLAPASRVALVGFGGVGKSQLAIEHAYRVQDTFMRQNKEIWAFWVYAETRARVEESFRAIAEAVRIPGRNQPKADILQLVYQWLQNQRNGQWLMVLDSADDINVFCSTDERAKQTTDESEKRALWTYLPQSSNGSILVTTRDKNVAFRLTGGYKNIIEVGPMDQDHALALLTAKLEGQSDMAAATELVKALDYIPLAISQAAAYIQRSRPRTSITKYLEGFQRSEQKRSRLLNYDAGDLWRDRSASNSVMGTWQISFDHIRQKRQSATELLSFMSFFDRQGILESLVRHFNQNTIHNREVNMDNESVCSCQDSDDGEFEEDITTLRDYCLINTDEEGNVFEMHGLVQLSIRKWLDGNGESEKFKNAYINRMSQAFPTGDFENWGTCRKLFPHVEKAINYRPVDEKSLIEWAFLLYKGSWYSRKQGRYATAETMAKKSWDTTETVLGAEHPNTLASMDNLAITYRNQGRWTEAEELQVQVIEIRKTKLGANHLDTLTSIHNLAITYQNQGRWTEAEELEVQVMEIRKTKLGADHPNTLNSMANLAITYGDQGRWTEAEELEVQVIEICKTKLGADHPDTLSSMNSLAMTYYDQRRWTDAIKLMEQCVQARIQVIGAEHPYTISSLSMLQRWRAEKPRQSEIKPYRRRLGRFFSSLALK